MPDKFKQKISKNYGLDYWLAVLLNLIVLYFVLFKNIDLRSFIVIFLFETFFHVLFNFPQMLSIIKAHTVERQEIIQMFLFISLFVGILLFLVNMTLGTGSNIWKIILNNGIIFLFMLLSNLFSIIRFYVKRDSVSVKNIKREYYYPFIKILALLILGLMWQIISAVISADNPSAKGVMVFLVITKMFTDFLFGRPYKEN